jgi:hypothetical protein
MVVSLDGRSLTPSPAEWSLCSDFQNTIVLSCPPGYVHPGMGKVVDIEKHSPTYREREKNINRNLQSLLSDILIAIDFNIRSRGGMFAYIAERDKSGGATDRTERIVRAISANPKDPDLEVISAVLVEHVWIWLSGSNTSPDAIAVPPSVFDYDTDILLSRRTQPQIESSDIGNHGLPISAQLPPISGHAYFATAKANARAKIKTAGPSAVDIDTPDGQEPILEAGRDKATHPIYALGRGHLTTITRLLSTGPDMERQGQLDWSDIVNVGLLLYGAGDKPADEYNYHS